jgi:hypothetical protein
MMASQTTPFSVKWTRPLFFGALLAGLVASLIAARPATAHRSTPTAHRAAALPGDGRVRVVAVSIRVTKDTQIDDTLTEVHVTEHQVGAFVLSANGSRPQRNSTLFTAPITGGVDTSVRYTPPPDQGESSACSWHDELHGQLQVGLHQQAGRYQVIFVPLLHGPAHECGQFNSTPELLIDDVTVPASLVARDRFSITAHGTMRVGVTESVHVWTARVTFARVR